MDPTKHGEQERALALDWRNTSFLVGGSATPLKNMIKAIGMIRNPIYGKTKNGNQTANQIYYQDIYCDDVKGKKMTGHFFVLLFS